MARLFLIGGIPSEGTAGNLSSLPAGSGGKLFSRLPRIRIGCRDHRRAQQGIERKKTKEDWDS